MTYIFRTYLLRALPLLGGAVLGITVQGCGAEPPNPDSVTPGVDQTSQKPGKALQAMGVDTAAFHADGTPTFLSGSIQTEVKGAAGARLLLLGQLASTYRLSAETDFRVLSEQTDSKGSHYIKLKQLYRGLEVANREVVVQTDGEGGSVAIIGNLAADLSLSTASTLAGDEAVKRALAGLVQAGSPAPRIHEPPVLQIFVGEEGQPVLSFRALVEYIGPEGRALDELFASARDGALVANHSRIYQVMNREVYDLKKACLMTGSELPGTLVMREGETATDTSAQNAYDHTGATYWYYKHFYGRDSYDGSGALMKSSVHGTFSSGASCSGNNAAWLSDPFNQMVYGDGDGSFLKDLTLGLDVAAHELTHAVTSRTSNLTYLNESGAINEMMSDIQGSGAHAWIDSGGSAAGNPGALTTTANTWKIGEAVAGRSLPGGALRFMNNPTADGQSKDYYADRILPGGVDRGGVHLNSGIGNLAFYLLSEGGRHPRGKTPGVTVQGISMEKALQIFYLTNTQLITTATNFQTVRYATARAAETLYGRCGQEWRSVLRAWDAVGVPGAWQPCVRPPSSPL